MRGDAAFRADSGVAQLADNIQPTRYNYQMHNRIASILGGVGLFAAVLGFTGTALAPLGEGVGPWGLVMALGLAVFLGSIFRRADEGPGEP
jgi:hypothetical protein